MANSPDTFDLSAYAQGGRGVDFDWGAWSIELRDIEVVSLSGLADDFDAGSTFLSGKTIKLLGGDDYIDVFVDDVTVKGGAGDDRMRGDFIGRFTTNDTFIGGKGNDYFTSYDGRDTLIGGAGQDTFNNGNDRDIMKGGKGDDRFFMTHDTTLDDRGGDKMWGGKGADTFYFTRATSSVGKSKIMDFGPGDKIQFNEGFDTFQQVKKAARDVKKGVKIDFDTGYELMIRKIDKADLEAEMFIFL